MEPRSSAISRLPLRASGTSPLTMRGAALDDRGFADAGLADEDRVVLGAAGEHLDGAADLLVAADHRVEFAFARHRGHVAGVFLQCVEARLGVVAVTFRPLRMSATAFSSACGVAPASRSTRAAGPFAGRRAPPATGPARRTRRRPSARPAGRRRAPAPGPACSAAGRPRRRCTLGISPDFGVHRGAGGTVSPPAARIKPPAAPSSSSSNALSRCSGVSCWWNSRMAIVCAAWIKPRERSVNFSMSIYTSSLFRRPWRRRPFRGDGDALPVEKVVNPRRRSRGFRPALRDGLPPRRLPGFTPIKPSLGCWPPMTPQLRERHP